MAKTDRNEEDAVSRSMAESMSEEWAGLDDDFASPAVEEYPEASGPEMIIENMEFRIMELERPELRESLLELLRDPCAIRARCARSREGLSTGILNCHFTPAGQLLSGGTNCGWPVRGSQENLLERIDWTGVTSFDVSEL